MATRKKNTSRWHYWHANTPGTAKRKKERKAERQRRKAGRK